MQLWARIITITIYSNKNSNSLMNQIWYEINNVYYKYKCISKKHHQDREAMRLVFTRKIV